MRRCAALTLAVLMITASAAAADTLSVAVSPSSTTGNEPLSITVSGSAAPGRTFTVNAFPAGEPCPAVPYKRDIRDVEGAASTLPYIAAVSAPYDRGTYTLCGSLYEGESYLSLPIATAETSLTVTASPSEVEAAKAKASQEAAVAKTDAEYETKLRYEEEAPAREAAEGSAARAREGAEERAARAAAIDQDHKTPVSHLYARANAHPGNSSQHPGYTSLFVDTVPFAHVTITLSRRGHRLTQSFEWVGEPTDLAVGDQATSIEWSCGHPGGTYAYTVTARSDVGPTLTRHGHFSPVSETRCHTLKRREREAKERNDRRYAEEVGRQQRELREGSERFASNCRAEGGTPITIQTSGENVQACKAPGGGLLSVPT
jgi:hypothetical protein